ncbi:polyadenylate-binding protein 2-like isoform X2 [Dreissena polymorpha]|uniref:polyadenylate-binding protein 2-like isoform X2 n=1 Tax=Dreissena polymorpha TaxID=45954 RepID=UPI00226508CA|nr:polyadenylate-binding protein 2-like isoform X2 [Dreissena polymorpha]
MADTENGQDLDTLQDDGVGDFDADADVSLDDGAENDGETDGDHGADAAVEDPELEAIKARVKEMEEEAEKIREMQNQVDLKMNMSSPTLSSNSPFPTPEEKLEADARSIYVGNVDYGATAEELEQHFHGCGSVNRVTIQCDKYSGHPKGYAYIEFVDKDSVATSLALDDSLFRGRQIKVFAKRTNRPGISSTNRGRRGGRRARGGHYGGYAPRPRGRGGQCVTQGILPRNDVISCLYKQRELFFEV